MLIFHKHVTLGSLNLLLLFSSIVVCFEFGVVVSGKSGYV